MGMTNASGPHSTSAWSSVLSLTSGSGGVLPGSSASSVSGNPWFGEDDFLSGPTQRTRSSQRAALHPLRTSTPVPFPSGVTACPDKSEPFSILLAESMLRFARAAGRFGGLDFARALVRELGDQVWQLRPLDYATLHLQISELYRSPLRATKRQFLHCYFSASVLKNSATTVGQFCAAYDCLASLGTFFRLRCPSLSDVPADQQSTPAPSENAGHLTTGFEPEDGTDGQPSLIEQMLSAQQEGMGLAAGFFHLRMLLLFDLAEMCATLRHSTLAVYYIGLLLKLHHDHIDLVEQHELQKNLLRLISTATPPQAGPALAVTFNSLPELVSAGFLPSPESFALVSTRSSPGSSLSRSPELGEPFFFNPFAKKGQSEATPAVPQFGADETIRVHVVLSNPLLVPIEIQSLRLETSGLPFDAHVSVNDVLYPQTTSKGIVLTGRVAHFPDSVGPEKLHILGVVIRAFGVERLHALPGATPITANVVPPLPYLRVTSVSDLCSGQRHFYGAPSPLADVDPKAVTGPKDDIQLPAFLSSIELFEGQLFGAVFELENQSTLPLKASCVTATFEADTLDQAESATDFFFNRAYEPLAGVSLLDRAPSPGGLERHAQATGSWASEARTSIPFRGRSFLVVLLRGRPGLTGGRVIVRYTTGPEEAPDVGSGTPGGGDRPQRQITLRMNVTVRPLVRYRLRSCLPAALYLHEAPETQASAAAPVHWPDVGAEVVSNPAAALTAMAAHHQQVVAPLAGAGGDIRNDISLLELDLSASARPEPGPPVMACLQLLPFGPPPEGACSHGCLASGGDRSNTNDNLGSGRAGLFESRQCLGLEGIPTLGRAHGWSDACDVCARFLWRIRLPLSSGTSTRLYLPILRIHITDQDILHPVPLLGRQFIRSAKSTFDDAMERAQFWSLACLLNRRLLGADFSLSRACSGKIHFGRLRFAPLDIRSLRRPASAVTFALAAAQSDNRETGDRSGLLPVRRLSAASYQQETLSFQVTLDQCMAHCQLLPLWLEVHALPANTGDDLFGGAADVDRPHVALSLARSTSDRVVMIGDASALLPAEVRVATAGDHFRPELRDAFEVEEEQRSGAGGGAAGRGAAGRDACAEAQPLDPARQPAAASQAIDLMFLAPGRYHIIPRLVYRTAGQPSTRMQVDPQALARELKLPKKDLALLKESLDRDSVRDARHILSPIVVGSTVLVVVD